MPRKCIPQDEFVWFQAALQQCAPYNCRRRFRKAIRAYLRFTRAARIEVGEEIVGFDLNFFAAAKQQPLRSHGDSAKMTATITDCLANDCELCRTNPCFEIST